LACVGGTALRVLYDLNRFSEDLDFSLISSDNYNYVKMMHAIEKELQKNNFNVVIKSKDKKTVAASFIGFLDLPFELGLTKLKEQKISIKFEVDQNPPIGYQTKLSLINKDFLMAISHFDLPSLFASKLHAILCRKYVKGRDFYDLLWYLSKKTHPNYKLLEQAFLQTEKEKIMFNKEILNKMLKSKIEKIDFKLMQNDIAPFLVNASELRYFEKDFFLDLVESK
jgi:predicted nucleotidyltransferase component of viral defense system